MKKLVLVALLVLMAGPARADWLLSFGESGSEVWQSYTVRGDQYCTERPLVGLYCVPKADVVSIKKVPAGTTGSDYGVSVVGDDSSSQRIRENQAASDKRAKADAKADAELRKQRDLEYQSSRDSQRLQKALKGKLHDDF